MVTTVVFVATDGVLFVGAVVIDVVLTGGLGISLVVFGVVVVVEVVVVVLMVGCVSFVNILSVIGSIKKYYIIVMF